MGMTITVAVADPEGTQQHIDDVFAYFQHIDERFSTYKPTSEISQMNAGELHLEDYSDELREVLQLAELTRQQTSGYFDILRNGRCDPSGLVKGWAIQNAAKLLLLQGLRNFFVDAGGDIAAYGKNPDSELWRVGIRNPYHHNEIIKVLQMQNCGVATSGTYLRGEHIYNPANAFQPANEIVSMTVIAPTIYDADRFATAAFAMGKKGISFIEQLPSFEGYMIDLHGTATATTGFEHYVLAQ